MAGKNIDPEECDDGNLEEGDGCSISCTVEEDFYCIGGNRFGPDLCRNKNQSLYFRRNEQPRESDSSWLDTLLREPELVTPEFAAEYDQGANFRPREHMNMSDVHTGNRHLLQTYAGSIVVSLNFEFNAQNADLGNRTMKISHLYRAINHPDFLRRFQEQMRERENPVVVTWTQYVTPQ